MISCNLDSAFCFGECRNRLNAGIGWGGTIWKNVPALFPAASNDDADRKPVKTMIRNDTIFNYMLLTALIMLTVATETMY